MTKLDRRLNAFRPDLADARLRGRVEATRFTEGRPAAVRLPVAAVHSAPDASSGMDTQFLSGDTLVVFEERDGWAWVQADRDGYVGYVRQESIADRPIEPTHIVCAPRSFAYPGPELKMPPTATHSMGARVTVTEEIEERGTRYAVLSSGEAMIARHLRHAGRPAEDYVSVAEQFLHTPYLWGGASGFGIDCSGLVQLSFFMAGRYVPRDTDMQAAGLGAPLDDGTPIRRGDLIFWRGHVAIALNEADIIHANGHAMMVSQEPLAEATRRIAPLYGRPVGIRRVG